MITPCVHKKPMCYKCTELLKCGGDAIVDELTKIANMFWHTVKITDDIL